MPRKILCSGVLAAVFLVGCTTAPQHAPSAETMIDAPDVYPDGVTFGDAGAQAFGPYDFQWQTYDDGKTERTQYTLSRLDDGDVLVADMGALMHEQIPTQDAEGTTLYDDWRYARFWMVGAPEHSQNLYFIVMPIGPSDDPFEFLLFRLNLETRRFTEMKTSALFGSRYNPLWLSTPDYAALVWTPFDSDIDPVDYSMVFEEPRVIYLIDLEKDVSKKIVTLGAGESLSPAGPSARNDIHMSVREDGTLAYEVFSIAKRASVSKAVDPYVWSDLKSGDFYEGYEEYVAAKQQLSLGTRTVQTGHGKVVQ